MILGSKSIGNWFRAKAKISDPLDSRLLTIPQAAGAKHPRRVAVRWTDYAEASAVVK